MIVFLVTYVIFQMIISRDIDVMSISGRGHHWAVATTWKSCSIYLNSFINKSKHDCYLITKTAFSMVKSPGKCRRYKKIKRNSLEKKTKDVFMNTCRISLFSYSFWDTPVVCVVVCNSKRSRYYALEINYCKLRTWKLSGLLM